MLKPSVLFVITIDTEEEWLWMDDFPQDNFSVKNVNALPEFNTFVRGLGVKPTYFVDYAVAANAKASHILKDIYSQGGVEIGSHLHPWCNPPYFGRTRERESHVINLPLEQVEQKLDALNQIINQNLGVVPISFRSGRWGVSGETLSLLANKGYTVDSSVYPFYENEFFSCYGSPLIPYWPSFDDSLKTGEQRNIMELPVTAGFNNRNFNVSEKIHRLFSSPHFSWSRMVGLLWHSKLLRKLYLSPELFDAQDMKRLIDKALAREHPVIHMYLHSSSLIDGATGLLNIDNALQVICQRIEESLDYLESKASVTYCTISEAASILVQSPELNSQLPWNRKY